MKERNNNKHSFFTSQVCNKSHLLTSYRGQFLGNRKVAVISRRYNKTYLAKFVE